MLAPSPLCLPFLSGQMAAFRSVNATAIQRMIRGMQARALFRKVKARALVQRQMLFFLSRAFVASAKVARRIREEMLKKNVSREMQAGRRGRLDTLQLSRLRLFVCGLFGNSMVISTWSPCFKARSLCESARNV